MVQQRGGRVLLSCPSALGELTRGFADIQAFHPEAHGQASYVCHAPLLSLPGLFGTDLDSIPAQVPYLKPDPVSAALWRERLAGFGGFKVGVVWRGNPQHKNDRNRSMTAALFSRFLSIPGLTVVNLQKDATAAERAALAVAGPFLDAGPDLDTFSDTAAVVAALDLVISVDTAVCHLAGALAVPVWILIPFCPDWRWLLDREDSPWYPTARLFRQPKIGDWSSVVDQVAAALEEAVIDSPG